MSPVVKSFLQPFQFGLHPSENAQTLLRIFTRGLIRSGKPFWQTSVHRQIHHTTSHKPPVTSAILTLGKHPQRFHRSFHPSPFHLPRRPSQPRNTGGDEAKIPSNNVKEIFNLPQRRINIIFGNGLSQDDGNELLSELQKHRLRGTPDTKVDFGPDAIASGLQYLRARYPMDEDAAIIARVDKEMDHQFRAPQTDVDYSPSGQSRIMRIREENEKRFDREEKRRKADEEKERLTLPASNGSRELVATPRTFGNLAHGKERTGEEPEWVKEYRRQGTQTEIPPISTFARLFPSGLFTAGVVLLSLWLAQNYIPPGQRARMFPDTPPAAATLLGLVAINVAVFMLWRTPPMWAFMNKYFIVVPLQPRAASMFLAEFSHQQVPHFVFNMSLIWFVGGRLHDEIGRGQFLAIVFASAVLSSYVSMSTYVLSNILTATTIGASGIASGIIAALCTLNEGRTITMPFLSAESTSWLNSGVMLALFVLLEVIGLRRGGLAGKVRSENLIDHVGHLGGYATGLTGALMLRHYDPKWRGVERHSFWHSRYGKQKDQTITAELA